MAFLALGINHKTASVDVRERVAFTPEQLVDALQQLCRLTTSREAAILSTCNRSELYIEQDHLSADAVLQWLADYHRLSLDELRASAYVHEEHDAVRHMMRVASGLDSLVLGEPQILGQMKSAYAVAREAGTVGPLLGRLFQATFSAAKQVRTDTAIGENPVSVAFAAVSLAKQIFSDLARSQALLIGAGETITLVARHLHEQGVRRIVVANRTLERASTLAEQFGAHAVLLADIPQELANSDIVISSTASQLPILGKGAVESALKQRRHKPIFMVDIAVPRDIETEVGELDDVYLYTVDDLHDVVAENLKSRQGAAQAAEELVAVGAEDFMARLRELAAVDVLRAYRQQSERLRDEELQKAQRLLANGGNPEEVLAQLARGLTNKLLHAPSVQLKKLSAEGRLDALAMAQELFALHEGSTDKSPAMKASLLNKLDILQDRFEELTALLGDAEVISDQTRFRAYSREYAEVEPVYTAYRQWRKVQDGLEGAQALLKDSDPDMREMAVEEVREAKEQLVVLESQLQRMLLPKDPNDGRNVFLEIRAGTGGDEAAIFSGDLFRMYSRYAEKRGWRLEILSENEGEHGGYKEIIARVEGENVYGKLKFESGAHRVQRVPETESQGRIHTSACTVAVLPEPDEQAAIEINPADLRVDTYRASGAGGQHVNKTDSAIRITHLPTGIVVECQEERSQHKNRARALSWLSAKLNDMQTSAAQNAIASERKLLVGSGDRSERIRTYNYPQGRVTDHRINLTLYSLDDVLAGGVDAVIEPLLAEYQADQLAALGGLMTIIASLLRNAQLPDSPTERLDAELLLAAALGKSRSYLHTWPERIVSSEAAQTYDGFLKRRRDGEPVAYILGLQGFWKIDLEVAPHTLIPRPDTELLVETALELQPARPANVLDLGTGTGAIALALASERPAWQVTAVDRVPEAAALAERNRQRLGLANVRVQVSHWFDSLAGERFDLIVSNPPYIAASDPHLVDGDVRFEPSSALVAGADGLDDLRIIAAQAPAHLAPGGWLLLEHGYDQAAAVQALLRENGFADVSSRIDLGGHERITLGRLPC